MSANTRAGAILREAATIVDGARNVTHGDKERSFAAIASLWTAFLAARRVPGAAISPADASAMMVLLKFSRSEHGQHIADHGIDATGYAAIWGELREAPQFPVGTPEGGNQSVASVPSRVVVTSQNCTPAAVVSAAGVAFFEEERA